MSRVIVVGGGASGMLAAYSAAGMGHQVLLLEKNEKLGKKVYITGKGRCNVTNSCEKEEILKNVVTNSKFLYSSLFQFDNLSIMELLEEHGCPLKVERGGRVFPTSDRSSDVIKALVKALQEMNVEIQLHTTVHSLLYEDATILGVELESGEKMFGDAVVLACGGLSYPSTGSTGDGYRMAEQVGHSMKPCYPSLVPFEIQGELCKRLQGLALKNVSIKLEADGKCVYQEQGEMLFTHFGVSGPLILSASSFYNKYCEGKKVKLVLDLKPALEFEKLDKRVLRDFENNNHKEFKNALSKLLPSKLIPVIVELSGIAPDKKVYDISKQERFALVTAIKRIEFTVKGTRDFQEAIITQGGISVKEVNPSTMESKLCKGLYLVGEMLDLDALTGGYNLQIAWSTGHLAGTSIPW